MHIELSDTFESPKCKRCQEFVNSNPLICSMCGVSYHKVCVKATHLNQRLGPWYCRKCKKTIKNRNLRDILVDE